MKPKICIIILNWNGKKDSLECLSSIQKIIYKNFETVIVDNGSTDDSVQEIRKQFPWAIIIETGKNLGYAEGNNVGLRYGMAQGADLLFILNNDTVVDPNILNDFVSGFAKEPNAGILGAKIFLYSERNKFDHLGGNWNKKTSSFDLVGNREIDDGTSWESMQDLDYVCGAGFMIRKEVILSIGMLEPKFFLYWEDADFCFRTRRAGFRVMTCPPAKLWHKVSSSFVGGKTHISYFYWRNRLLWMERNLSKKDKALLFFPIFFHILNIYKLKTIKTLQLYFIKFFYSEEEIKKRTDRIQRYRAVLAGTKDYILRKFGDGPSWIYKK